MAETAGGKWITASLPDSVTLHLLDQLGLAAAVV